MNCKTKQNKNFISVNNQENIAQQFCKTHTVKMGSSKRQVGEVSANFLFSKRFISTAASFPSAPLSAAPMHSKTADAAQLQPPSGLLWEPFPQWKSRGNLWSRQRCSPWNFLYRRLSWSKNIFVWTYHNISWPVKPDLVFARFGLCQIWSLPIWSLTILPDLVFYHLLSKNRLCFNSSILIGILLSSLVDFMRVSTWNNFFCIVGYHGPQKYFLDIL